MADINWGGVDSTSYQNESTGDGTVLYNDWGADMEGVKDCEFSEPVQLTGECFNCGQIGHIRADCSNPKLGHTFTGSCRICSQEGHKASECPDRKPVQCRICDENHQTNECTAPRLDIFPDDLPEMAVDVAWDQMIRADKERDMDNFMEAFYCYAKAQYLAGQPIDLVDLENGFRYSQMQVYLIAARFEIAKNKTVVNLAGLPEQEFCLIVRFSSKPERQIELEFWPKSPEDNIQRLKKCGFEVERKELYCHRCCTLGHTAKHPYCPSRLDGNTGTENPQIKCINCGEVGHRIRDCKQERIGKTNGVICRNCDKPGHKATECEEPRNMDNVECNDCKNVGHFSRDCPDKHKRGCMTCRNCNQEGHMAKECTNDQVMICRNCNEEGHKSRDCPNPRDESNIQCHNCDGIGHSSRNCPKSRDYSRIKCRNCSEMGHTSARCTKPVTDNSAAGKWSVEKTNTMDDGTGRWNTGDTTTIGGDNWENTGDATAGDDWGNGDSGW